MEFSILLYVLFGTLEVDWFLTPVKSYDKLCSGLGLSIIILSLNQSMTFEISHLSLFSSSGPLALYITSVACKNVIQIPICSAIDYNG